MAAAVTRESHDITMAAAPPTISPNVTADNTQSYSVYYKNTAEINRN